VNDYFGRVQQELRSAVGRRSHLPWYLRIRLRLSRPAIVALAGLVATGSALAASGILRTGAPVGAPVPAIPNAYEGAVIPGSVHLLPLRVPDPDGGPPWGLRVLKTTRGLTCVQFGRVVGGRLGVLGRDGAFADDGAFHPLSSDFLDGVGCGTDDARGNAFVNEQFHGIPASALSGDQQHTSGGCYTSSPRRRSCPLTELRDVYFGLLGPDAVSITRNATGGAGVTIPTVGSEGAYLIVLPHSRTRCAPQALFCARGESFSTGGPELVPYEVIRAVGYRGGKSCDVPTPAQLVQIRATENARFRAVLRARMPRIYREVYRRETYIPGSLSALTPSQERAFEALRSPYLRAGSVPTCPVVGYTAGPGRHVTAAQLASKVSARAVPARLYCEKADQTVPCDGRIPRGYRRIDMSGAPPELLLVVEFTARAAVTNFDSHYEINTSDPSDPGNPKCLGAGAGQFGPTQRNLRAGQRVRYTEFVDRACPGRSRVTVGYVTVDGPSGAAPVPGLPGQSAEIPVGQTTVAIP
jgi:hypothetical protein